MKRLLIALLLLGAGYASAAEFSGNVGYFSDYRFRGISQGDRSPAIQGGFDIELDGGFYLGNLGIERRPPGPTAPSSSTGTAAGPWT